MNPRFLKLVSGLLLSSLLWPVLAQTPLTPKAQYTADSKAAQTRYDADKKLCVDETSANARLQCRRDAKTEYDRAITTAKAQLAAATPASAAKAPVAKLAAACADCGVVVAVSETEKAGEGTPLGLIAGGVAGAILGHQVGSGTGKDLATVAGAAGGAYAGKKIEERVKTSKVWVIGVQYPDGQKRNFEFAQSPGLKVGERVKNSGNSIVRY